MSDTELDDTVILEVSDVLDLHTFAPSEVPSLVRDYVDECIERGFSQVRIVHGKGIGNLRRTVHGVLSRHEGVRKFTLGDESAGGWGATIVQLKSK